MPVEHVDVFVWAAEGGHLEVVRWAREHDCPWDARNGVFAAMGGHLEVLRGAGARLPVGRELCMRRSVRAHEIIEAG